MKRLLHLIILYALLAVAAPLTSAAHGRQADVPVKRLEAERLPDLNAPRSGHQTLFVGGQLMVAGGHTSGFVPTATAEFLSLGDGQWRVQPTIYTHDFGTSVVLASGEVLLLGGAEQPLGIGQTFCVERYDPVTRQFDAFCCLDTKRMYAEAARLADGTVLVCGNWYHRDTMELFDGKNRFEPVKAVQLERACPYIFPFSDSDALVFGSLDTKGIPMADQYAVADRLRGQPFEVPLLREWQPICLMTTHPADASLIGDTARGDYGYLVLMQNRASDVRIALVRDTTISLLPSLGALPRVGPSGRRISYFTSVVVDRRARRGYVVGHDSLPAQWTSGQVPMRDTLCCKYVFSFSYAMPGQNDSRSVEVSDAVLYYTDPLPGLGYTMPVLTDNGDLVLVAGTSYDHFAPFSAAYRLLLGQRQADAAAAPGWLWWALGGVALLLAMTAVVVWRRGAQRRSGTADAHGVQAEAEGGDDARRTASPTIMPRLRHLMEQQRPYLQPDLKLQDVADALGVDRRTVTDAIASAHGCSFAQFVNGYRIEHAKSLLTQQPHQKMATVYMASGFANENSFFRTFKAFTGLTPRNWVAQQDQPAGSV